MLSGTVKYPQLDPRGVYTLRLGSPRGGSNFRVRISTSADLQALTDKKLVVLNILNWNCMWVDAQTHKYGMEMVLRPVNDHHLEEAGTTILLAQAKCVSSAACSQHYVTCARLTTMARSKDFCA